MVIFFFVFNKAFYNWQKSYLMNGSHFIKGSIAYTRSSLLQVLKAFENAPESQSKYVTGNSLKTFVLV